MAIKTNKTGKIVAIVALLIGAAIAGWLMFRKSSTAALDNAPSVAPWDDDLLKRLQQYFRDNAEGRALAWLTPLARENYDNKSINPDYLINGQVTKSGAFLATYAAAYHSNPETVFKIDRDVFNETIYRIFYEEKAKQETI